MAHRGHVDQPFPSPNGEVIAQKGEILWPSLHSKQVAKPGLEFGLFIYKFVVLGIKPMAPCMPGKLSIHWATWTTQTQTPYDRKVTWGQLTLKLEVNGGGGAFVMGVGISLIHMGREPLNWGISAIRLACGQFCELFSWLLVHVEGPRSLSPV